jgi:hypothetical protein
MTKAREQARSKWRSLIAEQEESGERVTAFCRMRGLERRYFYYWKRRLRETAVQPQFVELQLTKPALSHWHVGRELGSTIEVRLRNGRSLMVAPEFDALHLRALLAVVESES